MDPLEWLARVSDHIPDPGKHRTLAYGHYANRVRGDRAAKEPGTQDKPAKKRRGGACWARLISKVFHADPLKCRDCGGPLQIVAYITDQLAINKYSNTSASARQRNRARHPKSATFPPTTRGGNSLKRLPSSTTQQQPA